MKIPATIARLFGRRDVDERRTMFMERRSEWVQASAQAPEHRGSEMAVGEGDSCRYSFLGVGLAVCLYNNPEYGSWDPPELQGNNWYGLPDQTKTQLLCWVITTEFSQHGLAWLTTSEQRVSPVKIWVKR